MPRSKKPSAKKKAYVPPAVAKAVTTFLWHGRVRYRCSECIFDSSTEAEALAHYQKTHVIPEPRKEVQHIETGLVDPSGDKIVRVEEVANGTDGTDSSTA